MNEQRIDGWLDARRRTPSVRYVRACVSVDRLTDGCNKPTNERAERTNDHDGRVRYLTTDRTARAEPASVASVDSVASLAALRADGMNARTCESKTNE